MPYHDRKSTRLNSSHGSISYAVFCLKKKKIQRPDAQVLWSTSPRVDQQERARQPVDLEGRSGSAQQFEEERAGLLRFFFFNDTATTEIYTLSLHDALPI